MVSKKPEIMVLCGGRGKRMGKLTDNEQKSILKIGRKPILAYLLEQVSKAFGKTKVILVVAYKGESVRNYFGNSYKRLQLEYVEGNMEEARLSILATEDSIKGDDFLSLASDTIVKGSELLSLVEAKTSNLFGTILLSSKIEVAPTHGLAIMKDRKVSKVIYPPKPSTIGPDTYVIIGPAFYSRKLFEEMKMREADGRSELLMHLVKEGKRVEGEICTTPWFHFASPEDLKVKIEF